MGKQTAGRDNLCDFAPKFAELNDDVLFGEVWSRGYAIFKDQIHCDNYSTDQQGNC